MPHPKRLLFLHIPKTAGSTMQGILEHNYGKRVRYEATRMWLGNPAFHALSDEQRNSLELLMGHMPFGLHEKLGGGSFEYFTILREPVDRVISLYYHILRNKHHPFHEQLVAQKTSIADLMDSGLWKAFDNCQVRMLSGDLDVPYGGVTEEHYNKAVTHLEQHFPLVGVQHHFDEFVLQLSDRYHWKFPYYRRFQVSTNRVAKDKISASDIEGIRRHNQFDEKLVKLYAARAEEEIRTGGEDFQRKLRRYRRRNKFFERLLSLIPVRKKPHQQ